MFIDTPVLAPQNRKQLYIGLVVPTAEMYMDFTSHWGYPVQDWQEEELGNTSNVPASALILLFFRAERISHDVRRILSIFLDIIRPISNSVKSWKHYKCSFH